MGYGPNRASSYSSRGSPSIIRTAFEDSKFGYDATLREDEGEAIELPTSMGTHKHRQVDLLLYGSHADQERHLIHRYGDSGWKIIVIEREESFAMK